MSIWIASNLVFFQMVQLRKFYACIFLLMCMYIEYKPRSKNSGPLGRCICRVDRQHQNGFPQWLYLIMFPTDVQGN